ncbi:DUF5683 domain-containing protein [Portibacter lacus]|uniref:DUF5683 domain-containing protein n=1 Tax=Portibacter lacus TaxID=1099794 RepID=A0AA37WF18_9BACT|nr:DUF5683 domain-containing protein [Portibacter lacus]GLR18403.1 hypothetical protein GCM10007940_30190 [Portibacter lacus]
MRYLIFLIFFILSFYASGQSPLTNDYEEDLSENFIDPDSVDYESYTKKTSSFKALFNGKPGQAIMYGMLIPGGGQIYNKKYWKVPIAWVAEGAGIWTFVYLRSEYNNFNDAYRQTVLGEEGIEYRGVSGTDRLNSYRKQFQKYSEQAGVGMIVIHIIAAVEAYIDRHLTDFDIDEDLSFDYTAPNINNNGKLVGVTLSYKF